MSKALLLAGKYTGENKTFLEIGCVNYEIMSWDCPIRNGLWN